MGENDNNGEDTKKVDGAADQGADDTQDQGGQNDGGADDKGASGDDKGDGAGDGADDKGGGEDKGDKPADKKTSPNADEEPPARKRNIDFINARKNAKATKQADKDNKPADDKGDDKGEDDDIADVDAEVIDKRVQAHLKPFIEKQAREEDENEINSFLAENADFKPYADKVKKWAQHPSRAGIPIEALFYEVAGKDLIKIGADRAKAAIDEAKKSGAGGGNNRGDNGQGSKPVLDQTPEEFEATQNAVRSKGRE